MRKCNHLFQIYCYFHKFLIFIDISRYINVQILQSMKKIYFTFRGRLHGELSTPGLNSVLLTGLKFFAITWTISTPGLKRYNISSRHRFPEVKKHSFCFLEINSHCHARMLNNFSPGLKWLHDKIFNPGLSSTPGLKFQPG